MFKVSYYYGQATVKIVEILRDNLLKAAVFTVFLIKSVPKGPALTETSLTSQVRAWLVTEKSERCGSLSSYRPTASFIWPCHCGGNPHLFSRE